VNRKDLQPQTGRLARCSQPAQYPHLAVVVVGAIVALTQVNHLCPGHFRQQVGLADFLSGCAAEDFAHQGVGRVIRRGSLVATCAE